MRGGDPRMLRPELLKVYVSPACAGVIPIMINTVYILKGKPRMRGGDPLSTGHVDQCIE